jgi:hypothetical protein
MGQERSWPYRRKAKSDLHYRTPIERSIHGSLRLSLAFFLSLFVIPNRIAYLTLEWSLALSERRG